MALINNDFTQLIAFSLLGKYCRLAITSGGHCIYHASFRWSEKFPLPYFEYGRLQMHLRDLLGVSQSLRFLARQNAGANATKVMLALLAIDGAYS